MKSEKLERYCDVISGYAFKSTDWRDSGVPVVKIGNISNGTDIIFDEQIQYVEEEFKNKIDSKYLICKGDILLSLTGSHINQPNSMVGRCCRNRQNKLYFLNQRAGKVIPFSSVDKSYLYYLLSTKEIKYTIANKAYGGANQVNISPRDIKNIRWTFPRLEIQQRIASILSAYDDLIEKNNRRIQILEQMAENLYKEWFVRFRFPGHEQAEFENGIPKEWKEDRLGNRMAFTRGASYTSSDIQDGDNILLSMNNIRPFGGFIRDFSRVFGGKVKKKHLVSYGDLIMAITDMTQDRRIIGYVGWVDTSRRDCVISTHLMKIDSELSCMFLLGFFNSSGLSRMIAEYATGANVLGITEKILIKIKSIFPPVELIAAYDKTVHPYFEMVAKLRNQNDILTKQRDKLLPRMMSGKLEV